MSRNDEARISTGKAQKFIIINVKYDPYFEIHPIFPGEDYKQDTVLGGSIIITSTDGDIFNIEGEFCEEHIDVKEARAQIEIFRITHRVMES
jgi:hypothetical protein